MFSNLSGWTPGWADRRVRPRTDGSSPRRTRADQRPHVPVSPSGPDVSGSTRRFLAARLREHRRSAGTRWPRLTADRQALPTPAYRYRTEAVDRRASLAPTPAAAVRAASTRAFAPWTVPCCRSTGCTSRPEAGVIAANRPFPTGKYPEHGVHVQVLADPVGRLLWARPPCPAPSMTFGRPAATALSMPWPQRAFPAGRTRHTAVPGARSEPLPGPVGDSLRRPAGGQPIPHEDPRPRRAGRRPPHVLAHPGQAPLFDHPGHRPRPGRPLPASGRPRQRTENAH